MKVFGHFEFDERSRQLRSGGRTLPLNAQCLDLLALLLDRPGELVTREEIRRVLWPDSNVDFEHSLDVLVNRLRMALGDKGKMGRYIQTVPRKGYRFVQQVTFGSDGPKPPRTVSRTRIFGQYASVAVLAALIALLIAHTRYDKSVPPHGAPATESSR